MSVTTMQASGSKPVFTCSECSATYSRMEYLRRHERKHTETRPFQCEECMKSFARSDVLLRHRRRCHPEAEAIREANALLDSQTEGNPVTSPTITSGRAKLRAAGLSKRPQGKTRQPNEPSSSPSEGVLSPELPSLSSDRLMHGPPPPPSQSGSSSTDTSAFAGLDQFFTFSGASTDLTSLTRSSPGAQSLVSAGAPSPTSLTTGNSMAPWMALPPLSMFSPNAILPKSASEVNQFGSWYVFPQRQSPTGSGARGSNGQILDLSKDGESSNTEAGPVGPYLLGDGETAEQLELDLLSPERAVFNAEWRVINGKRGPPLPPTDRFFIPPGLFAGCYTIPHWLLPPLTRLSKFAARTLTDHLVRFPLIHQATFKLSETPHWFAFAMCTVGGLNPTETHMKDMMGDTYTFKDSGAPWDGVQSIVRTEKVDMLVKTFVRHSAKLALCDQVSIVQSLLLYNTPAFLSDDPSERIIGHLFLGTVVKVIRKSGMFHPSADFASRLTVPADATLDARWRKWIRHETCRRSAWIVYILDTIASLEAAVPSLVSSRDLSHLALPASDSMWSARSDVEWAAFAEAGGYQTEGITLDIALRSVFGYDDAVTEGRPDATTGLRLGPFARTVVIMTLLRGLIEFGQGKSRGGVVTNTWITNGLMAAKGMPASHNWIIATYMRALAKWREGWDLDPLCMLLSMPQATSPSPSNSTSSPSPAASSPGDFSQGSPSSKSSAGTAFFASTVDTSPTLKEPVFVNDALPYYWLALVLVDMLKPGIAADTAQSQADATNPDMSTGATSLAQVLGNAIPQMEDPNGTGLSGIPDHSTYGGTPIIGARIVDLDEQNDKFADVDFREMLNIAKEFARGDTGTMRSPSVGPL